MIVVLQIFTFHISIILLAQDDIAGKKKGISKTLITLDIEAENVPDLTLIDLPGITRIAVEDQEDDIPEQVCYFSQNGDLTISEQ